MSAPGAVRRRWRGRGRASLGFAAGVFFLLAGRAGGAQAPQDLLRARLIVTSPAAESSVTGQPEIPVRGRLAGIPGGGVAVNGLDAPLDREGRFETAVHLREGANDVTIAAFDAEGHRYEKRYRVFRDSAPPRVQVRLPSGGNLTREAEILLRGLVDDDTDATVVANGVPVDLDVARIFEIPVPLAEGPNEVLIVATDAAGNTAETVVRIERDSTPPRLTAAAGPEPAGARRAVVTGTVDEDGCAVRVAGVEARVERRAFRAEVPLPEGGGEVEVVARDRAGNEASASVRLSPPEAAAPHLGTGRPYPPAAMDALRRLLSGGAFAPAEPPRNAAGLIALRHAPTELTFVLLPGGRFTMGSPESEKGRCDDEGPLRTVTVGPFLLSTTECTQAAWHRGGGAGRSAFPGDPRPVESVSGDQCREWCGRQGLRLPTEAEWEYACRAGTSSAYSFGEDVLLLERHAWFAMTADGETKPVAGLAPNPWGLFDMHGNVLEWCEDPWHPGYGGAPADGSARTAGAEQRHRVVRGGCWWSVRRLCRSSYRGWANSAARCDYIGFRPAASLP